MKTNTRTMAMCMAVLLAGTAMGAHKYATLTSGGEVVESQILPDGSPVATYTNMTQAVEALAAGTNAFATKVVGAIAGNLASLDQNGNPQDSGMT